MLKQWSPLNPDGHINPHSETHNEDNNIPTVHFHQYDLDSHKTTDQVVKLLLSTNPVEPTNCPKRQQKQDPLQTVHKNIKLKIRESKSFTTTFQRIHE